MNLKKHKLGIILTASLAVAALTLSVSAANFGASVEAVKDFDPASIDWSNVQEGELSPIGKIDPANFDDTAVTVAAGATLVEVKDFDPASIDWSNVQEGELTPIGEIDPANFVGTAVTAAR